MTPANSFINKSPDCWPGKSKVIYQETSIWYYQKELSLTAETNSNITKHVAVTCWITIVPNEVTKRMI